MANTIRDEADLVEARSFAFNIHQDWKRRTKAGDLIASGFWKTVWPDLSVEAIDPNVENTYIEALEDKSNAGHGMTPTLFVAPSTGTRLDRGEKQANKKRKVFVSYNQRSREEKLRMKWLLDWYQHGAAYSWPWVDWRRAPRLPFYIRHDPRHAYPLAHDSTGRLTSIIHSKHRRLVDIEQEWGLDHPAVVDFKRFYGDKSGETEPTDVEEIWFADTHRWGVALYVSMRENIFGQYKDPTTNPAGTGDGKAFFLAPPHPHNMSRCPAVENRRETFDGEYRGPIEAMTPNLKVAHNIMSRILEDMELQLGAPVVMDNIENWEEFGPFAHLRGTGEGAASVEFARPPSNFEAAQHVVSAVEASKRVGKQPQQRGGDPGASISSAKGSNVLMGTFNDELAVAQTDLAAFSQETLSVCAEFDVAWCDSNKKIAGFDQGEAYDETYTPSQLFNNEDYRLMVTYGGMAGLDRQNHLIQLALMKNSNAMSNRSFMQGSGLIDNVLQEEREIALDQVSLGFFALLAQQAQSGNNDPLLKFAEAIDDDDETARAAIMKTIKEMTVQSADPGPAPSSPADALLQARSLEAGGQPGSAAGLPPGPPTPGPGLQRALPAQTGRLAETLTPGGPT